MADSLFAQAKLTHEAAKYQDRPKGLAYCRYRRKSVSAAPSFGHYSGKRTLCAEIARSGARLKDARLHDVGGSRNRFVLTATSMEAESTLSYVCHLTILPNFRDTEDVGHVGYSSAIRRRTNLPQGPGNASTVMPSGATFLCSRKRKFSQPHNGGAGEGSIRSRARSMRRTTAAMTFARVKPGGASAFFTARPLSAISGPITPVWVTVTRLKSRQLYPSQLSDWGHILWPLPSANIEKVGQDPQSPHPRRSDND